MNLNTKFWLDFSSECEIPAKLNVVRVSDEVSLLRLAATGASLHVCGVQLCQWARNIAISRGISVSPLRSFREVLQERVPSITEHQAIDVEKRLGNDAWELSQTTLNVRDLLGRLYPGDLWSGQPNADHALAWLIWWVGEEPSEVDAVLATSAGISWIDEAVGLIDPNLYVVSTPKEAVEKLLDWLIFQPPSSTRLHPNRQIPSEAAGRLLSHLQYKLAVGSVTPDNLRTVSIWKHLRSGVADTLCTFLENHPDSIDDSWVHWVDQRLGPNAADRIRKLLTLPDPGGVPSSPHDVLEWYRSRYLPWRQQKLGSGDGASNVRWRELGSAFGRWYVSKLPDLTMNPNEQGNLVWVRAHRLQQTGGPVSLLVIADGMLPRDVRTLLMFLNRQVPQLKVVSSELAFTQLPSVTEFTKSAIKQKDVIARIVQDPSDASSSRVERVCELLESAGAGDVVTWTLAEPDHTYHFKNSTELDSAVESELFEIAANIRTIVDRISTRINEFQVVFTADHGRLLGESIRDMPPPYGLIPHGRAAWGSRDTNDIVEGSFRDDGDLIWLNPSAYGLPADMSFAVVTNHRAFVTADGKGGVERFPHGGLFPEEIIVPWVRLSLNLQMQDPAIEVSGTGAVGQLGRVVVRVTNPNSFELEIRELVLIIGTHANSASVFNIHRFVPAMSTIEHECALAPWPDVVGSNQSASIRYRRPSGEDVQVSVTSTLTSTALYRSDNILGDLM